MGALKAGEAVERLTRFFAFAGRARPHLLALAFELFKSSTTAGASCLDVGHLPVVKRQCSTGAPPTMVAMSRWLSKTPVIKSMKAAQWLGDTPACCLPTIVA